MKWDIKFLAKAGITAGLYATLTIAFAFMSYQGNQVRIAEALTVLPYLEPASILGLFGGCFLANLYGGLGPWDIFGGSLCTLIAAYLTYRMPKPWLAPLPPIFINAFGVSAYLQFLVKPPILPLPLIGKLPTYWLFVVSIGMGELIACYLLGYPLLLALMKHGETLGFSRKDK